jgi:hypothetical protein
MMAREAAMIAIDVRRVKMLSMFLSSQPDCENSRGNGEELTRLMRRGALLP